MSLYLAFEGHFAYKNAEHKQRKSVNLYLKIHRVTAILWTMMATLSALTSCGWKGEPVPDETVTAKDTVFNDLTYTAVTGNISALSAVAATLHGFANSSEGYNAEFSEQGFLLSRNESNPTLDREYGDNGLAVRRLKVDYVESDNSMSVRAFGLLPDTKFYYRSYVIRKNGDVSYGVAKAFKTLTMSITLDSPTRTGLFDCDVIARVTGFGAQDYDKGAVVRFRYADAPITGATTIVDGETPPLNDRHVDASQKTGSLTDYAATLSGLIPGKKYYVVAYVLISSDFYNYDVDNPHKDGEYAYGNTPDAVMTDKYQSRVIEVTATALAGIRSFAGKDYALDYDAVTIYGNSFTLPSDTLAPSEYGIVIAEGDKVTENGSTFVRAQDGLDKGNRYDIFHNGLKLKTKYSYRSYVIVCGLLTLSQETYTFETKDYDPKYVDLGLSVYWADRNIGAYSRSSAGAYYAWGEVSSKSNYVDDNFCGGALTDTDIGGGSKDVATMKWGSEWRMPSCEEIKELYNECGWKWTIEDGMSGFLITGPNENTIFLPASGIKIKKEVQDLGKMGYFWTSERASADNEYGFAYEFYILNGLRHNDDYPLRKCHPTFGLNVRPVRIKE